MSLKLTGVQVRFVRYINYNDKTDKNIPNKTITHNLFCRIFNFGEQKKNYKFKVDIESPNEDFSLDPNVLYSLVEGFYNKLDFPQVDLFPFCSGGLIECLYVINIILCFESMATTNETISIPIIFR